MHCSYGPTTRTFSYAYLSFFFCLFLHIIFHAHIVFLQQSTYSIVFVKFVMHVFWCFFYGGVLGAPQGCSRCCTTASLCSLHKSTGKNKLELKRFVASCDTVDSQSDAQERSCTPCFRIHVMADPTTAPALLRAGFTKPVRTGSV